MTPQRTPIRARMHMDDDPLALRQERVTLASSPLPDATDEVAPMGLGDENTRIIHVQTIQVQRCPKY